MTKPSFNQFTRIFDRTVRHEPTGVTIAFPRAQPWRGDGFSLCSIEGGAADKELPDGTYYRLRDLIEAARDVMRAESLAQAS